MSFLYYAQWFCIAVVGEFEKHSLETEAQFVLEVQVKNKKPNKDPFARTSAEERFEADCSNVQPQLQ